LVGLSQPYLLALLPLVLGWIYWTYARRRPPVVPAAGVWLLQRTAGGGRARRRFDLRLALLLLAGAAMGLALTAPWLRLGRPPRLVVVIDASASMSARGSDGRSRLDRARERAAPRLEGARRAVLVRAGLEPQAWGPTDGSRLEPQLTRLRAGDAVGDLERAVALGRARLPDAAVLVVGDAPPPASLRAGFLNVAGDEPNAGITALGPRFAAVYNAGPGVWNGTLTSGQQRFALRLAPGRFATFTFDRAADRRTAVLAPGDAMLLDQKALWIARPARVRVETAGMGGVDRALAVLGVRRVTGRAQAEVRTVLPPERPARLPTLYFAPAGAAAPQVVHDVDPTHPFTRGVKLVGYRLPAPPPPPGAGWRTLATQADGRGVIFVRGSELYLPPEAALRNLPAFVVLIYNWLQPLADSHRPLGWNGVLEPTVRDGYAVSLLDYRETRLPRPAADRLAPVTAARPLAPWLALLSALLLALQAPRPAKKALG